MFSRGGFGAKASRRRLCGTAAAPDKIAKLIHVDPAKARVMNFIGELVADGFATWALFDNGEIELSLRTGEIFILADKAIIRLA